MKKLTGILVMAVFVLTAMSSCKQCYTCDFGGNDVREYCSKDFPDGTSGLKLTISGYEDRGYKCTKN